MAIASFSLGTMVPAVFASDMITVNNMSSCMSINGMWSGSTCTLSSSFTITSGTTVEIPSGIILIVSGSNMLTINSGGTLTVDNGGTVDIDTSGNNLGIFDGGSFTNSAGATINVNNDGSGSNAIGIFTNVSSTLVNQGSIDITNSSGGTGIFNAGGSTSRGTIDNYGTVTISPAMDGSIGAENQGAINIDCGGSFSGAVTVTRRGHEMLERTRISIIYWILSS